jgi:hypothetical protein
MRPLCERVHQAVWDRSPRRSIGQARTSPGPATILACGGWPDRLEFEVVRPDQDDLAARRGISAQAARAGFVRVPVSAGLAGRRHSRFPAMRGALGLEPHVRYMFQNGKQESRH